MFTSRKITQEAVQCFYNRQKFNKSNMAVRQKESGGWVMELFGNEIAGHDYMGTWITDAGWPTKTTKDRLNGLDDVQVNTKKGQLYLNGKEWDGSKTYIKTTEFYTI